MYKYITLYISFCKYICICMYVNTHVRALISKATIVRNICYCP